MKKNILKVSLVAAFALFAGYNVYSSQKSDVISDLVLVNVEALADSDGEVNCCPDKGDTCVLSSGDVLYDQDECEGRN